MPSTIGPGPKVTPHLWQARIDGMRKPARHGPHAWPARFATQSGSAPAMRTSPSDSQGMAGEAALHGTYEVHAAHPQAAQHGNGRML